MIVSLKRKIVIWLQVMVLCLSLWINAVPVQAAPKQAEIVTTEEQGDLTVLFTFDAEVVDIVFISPTGQRKAKGDSDVEYAGDKLWCTYRIVDAQAGTWKVEYELGRNSEITFDIVEEEYGLWIQYLTVSENDGDKVSVSFQADYDSEEIYYNYELYAVSTTDTDAVTQIARGKAKSGEETETEVRLSGLSGDNYVLRLEVYYDGGDAEVFDAMISEAFDYENPNEPQVIENFVVKVDMGNLVCHIDWEEYVGRNGDTYQVEAKEAGEPIYEAEWERNILKDSILFSAGASDLEISLSYTDDNIRSAAKVKTIPLSNDVLILATPEVTNSAQAVLKYNTDKERVMTANVNGEEGSFRVNGNGEIAFDLLEGNNHIYAEIETDDLISYIVDTDIYCDVIPPEIKLYEDLDGKTFFTDSAAIIGKVSGANVLRIAGETITTGENGDFTYHAQLDAEENLIEIEAEDVNGNVTKMVLTLYRENKLIYGVVANIGLAEFLPFLVALLASMFVIIASLIGMKKPDKENGKKHRIWPWIIWDVLVAITDIICIWQFIIRYRFSNSMKFLEMTEKSASQAAEYLRWERGFAIAAMSVGLLFVISLVITIVIAKRNKKKQMKEQKMGE